MKRNIYTLATFALLVGFGANAQTIHTFAGIDTVGFSGDGGPATAAELNQPNVLAQDIYGNIYEGESTNSVIRKIDLTGTITTFAGIGRAYGYTGDSGPATAAELSGPSGIAIDGNGNVFISDEGNNVIRKVNTSGIITTVYGIGAAGYSGDNGPATAAEFNFPRDIKLDTHGNLFICDWLNYRVRKIDTTTGIITTAAGIGVSGYNGDGGPATAAEIGLPYRGAFDLSGNYFFIDGTNNIVRVISTLGIINTAVGNGAAGFTGDGGPATAAELDLPTAVTFDALGELCIADRGNDRLRLVNTSGTINTIAGNGVAGETGDGGPATAAEINRSFDVMFDGTGNLYTADINGNKIRKISTPSGVNEIGNSSGVSVYPEPNNGKFIIQSSLTTGESYLEVYTILGEKVFTRSLKNIGTANAIDISTQPNGVYIYKLYSDAGAMLGEGKLIIQK